MPEIEINKESGRRRFYVDDFSGGANMFIHPTKLKDNEFPVFENVMVRSAGSYYEADKRKGFERYNTNQIANSPIKSIAEYITANKSSNLQRLIAFTGGGTLAYTNVTGGAYTGSWTNIATGESDSKIKMIQFRDNLYIANRNSAAAVNKFYDGTNYQDMGVPPCNMSNTTFMAGTGGSLTVSKDYGYIVVFKYDNYQIGQYLYKTSAAIAGVGDKVRGIEAISLGAAENKITLANIPICYLEDGTTPDPRCTGRVIFRSKGLGISNFRNELEFMYYVTTIEDNTTTDYVDTFSDDELGYEIIANDYGFIQKPFRSKYHVVHGERIIQANIYDDLYTALTSSEVTLTPANIGGALTGGSLYHYKIYKLWRSAYSWIVSKPYEVSVQLGVGDDAVTIDITAAGDQNRWWNNLLITRASAGATTNYRVIKFGADYCYAYQKSNYPKNDEQTDASLDLTFNKLMGDTRLDYAVSNLKSSILPSEQGMPDLYDQTKIIPIDEGETAEITRIFSSYRRLDIFKNTSIHIIFTDNPDSLRWEANKIVSNTGSDFPESIVQMPDYSYYFCSTKVTAGGTYQVFYYWNGHGAPVEISRKIRSYLETTQITDIDGVYDSNNNFIRWTYTISGGAKGNELIYDLNTVDDSGLGLWNFNVKYTSDIELRTPYVTKGGKLLYGHERGYLYHQTTGNQDKLGASHTNTQINARVQSKTMDASIAELKIKRIIANITASGAGAADGLNIYYSDGTSETALTATLAAGDNRINKPVNVGCKQFYVRFENAENINVKFGMIGWDFGYRHLARGGR